MTTTIPVTYLDQNGTLVIESRCIQVTGPTFTTTYPFEVIYGIHPSPSLSTLTIQVYLSTASLATFEDNDEQKPPMVTNGQHSLVFKVESWTDELTTTVESLRTLVFPQANKQKRQVYVFLNPTSGNQRAKQSWTECVQPMLASAGFISTDPTTTVVVETMANRVRQQATELGQLILTKQQDEEALVLCLGGDGTLHDLMNGLLDSLPADTDAATAFGGIFRLGVIPAGSGNAFALSLNLHPNDIGHAALRVIHGQARSFHLLDIDVGTVNNNNDDDATDWVDHVVMAPSPKQRRVFVVVSWGFHAQILSKSRYLRYVMGNKRFSLVAMALLFFLHHYKGDVAMKQVRHYDRHTQAFDQEDTQVVHLSSSANGAGFTYFLATKQASLEPGFNITPFASPFDLGMDVLCMRNATADQLKTVAGLAFQGGKHVDHPAVDYYKTQELYLRVHEATDICLDGELLPVNAMDVVRVRAIQDPIKKNAFTVLV
ncbi:hypothetical protein [Absidia glauca]|uniref:DAGKc domain-containing protein n=1 Tax=Absidia glauca TaxID=4829 RepID=A0A163KN35_ABSGL|nr:hypothetical protein [Absidia glauca]